MKRLLWLLPVVLIAGLFVYLQQLRSAPPEVRFVRPLREQLVSTVPTNGKVEPFEFAAIRAGHAGTIERLRVEKGQTVAQGAVIAELDASEARAALVAADARVAQAQAELDVLRQGGRSRDLAEIDATLERARLDLRNTRRQLESLERLVGRQAATAYERDQAAQRVQSLETEIAGLERRRGAMVSPPDRASAEARLRDAQASVALARRQGELQVIRAPLAGTVYQLDVRRGAYLNPGDLVGFVGRLDRVRVIVYVDEPELGNIRTGQAVTITWDALPGKQWEGTVEKLPTQIVALGSRQVGEVICVIGNPDRVLLPQTNVNAAIRTNAVDNALTIPKEALRRERNQTGVYVLEADNTVRWQPVELGAASVTRIEIRQGLRPDQAVALPTDSPLASGTRVQPVVQAGG